MFAALKRSPAEMSNSRIDTDRRLAVVMGSSVLDNAARKKAIIHEARIHYGRLMLGSGAGKCRRRLLQRFDKGRPQQSTGRSKGTQAEWLGQRSAAVDAAGKAKSEDHELVTPQRRTKRELPDSLAKEVCRQRKIARDRKAEACIDGYLLPSEISPAVEKQAKAAQKKNSANDKKRALAWQAKVAEVASSTEAKPVCWALAQLPGPAHLVDFADLESRQKLQALGVQVTQDSLGHCHGVTRCLGNMSLYSSRQSQCARQDLKLANLFVVDDSGGDIRRKVRVMAALRGGVVAFAYDSLSWLDD